jgi:hypothetical protein
MNWVIWWLESPWQIRAFVFLLAFVVCFVAPWLYNSGSSASVPAARKTAEENGDTRPALAAETPVQPPAEVPVQAVAPVQQEQVPVRPVTPEKRGQLALQAPIPSPAPGIERLEGGFTIGKPVTAAISMPAGSPIEKQEIVVSSESGGTAEIDVYLFSNRVAWSFGRSDRFVDPANRRVDLAAVLDRDAFAKTFRLYDSFVCLGLGSKSAKLSIKETNRLIDNRAIHLCGLLAQKQFVRSNTKIFALPLGQHSGDAAASSEKERRQRPVILIGIKGARGDLANAAVQKRVVSAIIRADKIENFPLSPYSEAAAGKDLRFIEVKGVKIRRKVKAVKARKWRPNSEFLWDGIEALTGREGRRHRGRHWRALDDDCSLRDRPGSRVADAASRTLPIGNRLAAKSAAGTFRVIQQTQGGGKPRQKLPRRAALALVQSPSKEETGDALRDGYRIALARVA